MEFKGTKGKWSDMDENNHGIDIVLDNETVISMDRQSRYSGEYVMEREEMKANAQLISKAPEMLEMLCRIVDDNLLDAYIGVTEEIHNLIKESTTI